MASNRSSSAKGSRGKTSGSNPAKSTGSVSAARLHQKSGSGNAFGGYTKVNHSNGTFSMRKSGK